MALGDVMECKPWGMVLVAVLIVLVLGAVALLLSGSGNDVGSPASKTQAAATKLSSIPELKGGFWACNGLVCKRTMTPQEWVTRFCFAKDGQNVCSVNTPQGAMNVPLSALNLTAITDCAEYSCVQEVFVRNASYTLPVP